MTYKQMKAFMKELKCEGVETNSLTVGEFARLWNERRA